MAVALILAAHSRFQCWRVRLSKFPASEVLCTESARTSFSSAKIRVGTQIFRSEGKNSSIETYGKFNEMLILVFGEKNESLNDI